MHTIGNPESDVIARAYQAANAGLYTLSNT